MCIRDRGKKGFSVDTASSNARARKQLDAQPYDLVLSDLRLPDQDAVSYTHLDVYKRQVWMKTSWKK